MLKKSIISIFLVIALSFSLCACGADKQNTNDENLKKLFTLVYDCPNTEILEAAMKGATHIGAGVSSMEEAKDYVSVYFEPYVAEDYIHSFLVTYGLSGYFSVDASGGKSSLESITTTETTDSNGQREFSAEVKCENSAGGTEIIEITGSYRQDESGKLTSIKYYTGYGEFSAFFQ